MQSSFRECKHVYHYATIGPQACADASPGIFFLQNIHDLIGEDSLNMTEIAKMSFIFKCEIRKGVPQQLTICIPRFPKRFVRVRESGTELGYIKLVLTKIHGTSSRAIYGEQGGNNG